MKLYEYLRLNQSKKCQIAKKAALMIQKNKWRKLCNKFISIYDNLCEEQPVKSDIKIHLEQWRKVVRVFGIRNGEECALSFTMWQIWLGSELVTPFSPIKTLANCLYEMTYNGFDQLTIQGKYQHLMDQRKKIADEGL